METKLYHFLCLCFGLPSAPKVFTKLMTALISILSRLNILIILYLLLNYLYDILRIARSQEEMMVTRDILTFLLQNLINVKKSILILQPCKKIEFSEVNVGSTKRILSLHQEKVFTIIEQYQLHQLFQQSALFSNSDFMSKTEAEDLIVTPQPTHNLQSALTFTLFFTGGGHFHRAKKKTFLKMV